ncbi:MAG: TRAP transporter substrate-binding protein [SAR324 cluster bacterium]|nr:TRAP transporter substrate-binding protein [SAR324 cluster bacterium]
MSQPKNSARVLIVATAIIALVFGIFNTPAFAAKKVRWKVPIAFSSKLPGLGTNIAFASKQIKAITNGGMTLKVYEPNKLLPPFQIMDAVSEGKVKAGYTWIGYDQGKISSLPLFSAVPFGMEPWEFTAWNYFAGGDKMLNKIYKSSGKNIHAVLCGIMGPETAGWFRKPIKSLDDFKGLKIRFAGLGGQVLSKLGASVTMLPGGELYAALEKGTIDATEFSMPAIDQLLGFHKVVKNNVFPGWHQSFTAMHLLVNEKAWKGLNAGQQATVNTTCMAATMRGLSEGEAAQGAIIAGFPEKGVKAQKLPLPVLRELRTVTNQVLAENAAKDADFKMAWDSQKKFSKSYAHWKNLGYLPRDF